MKYSEILNSFKQNEDYMNDRIKNGIENNRKGFAFIKVKDENGNAVKDATLKFKQKNHEFKHGANIFMLDEFETEEKNEIYKEKFKDAFNIATLPFYWDANEPEEGKTRYTKDSVKLYRRPAPDLCLEYCEKYGIEPKAHCLVYDVFTPYWARRSVNEMKRLYEKRMEELSSLYKDKIPSWEVINETLYQTKPHDSAFFYAPDYIEWSFENARRYFPNNNLIINDYGIMGQRVTNRAHYYLLNENLLNKGVSIDTIGIQFHMFNKFEAVEKACADKTYFKMYDPLNIYGTLDLYSQLGKEIQITEITIPSYSWNEDDEETQAQIIKNLYSMWFSHDAVNGAIYWNLADGYAAFAPLGDMTQGENYYHGGLLRHDMTPKRAFNVLKDLFTKEWITNTQTQTDDYGNASFKGFYGDYDVEIITNGKKYNKTLKLYKKERKEFTINL